VHGLKESLVFFRENGAGIKKETISFKARYH
jgi:hypothetical protein